jgi:hypothetical protein
LGRVIVSRMLLNNKRDVEETPHYFAVLAAYNDAVGWSRIQRV